MALWSLCSLVHSLCAICSDSVSGFHYGIYCCDACKTFFKYSALNKRSYVCRHEGSCNVNINARNRCPACYYEKCLSKGMALESESGMECVLSLWSNWILFYCSLDVNSYLELTVVLNAFQISVLVEHTNLRSRTTISHLWLKGQLIALLFSLVNKTVIAVIILALIWITLTIYRSVQWSWLMEAMPPMIPGNHLPVSMNPLNQ